MDALQLIIIGIPTYLRTKGLRRLLDGVADLTIPEKSRIEVLVVDNDPLNSGKGVVEEFVRATNFACSYLSEPRRGISHVRNRLLDFALEQNAEFLAFIDDDEVPRQDWLGNLMVTQRELQAAIVGGPVIRVFPSGTPAWYSRICFFEARREPTGLTRKSIDTGNSLLHLRDIRRLGLRFDESLSLSGGEDMFFSRQALQRGAVLVWAADAEVFEYVTASRLTRRWIIKRAFRSGCVTAVIDRKIHPWWLTWGRNLGKALLYFLAGGVKLLFCFFGNADKRYTPFIFWARGAGFLVGLAGFNYQEYRSPTGD